MSDLHRTHWTASELIAADFPPLVYAVDGLVPEGLSLLVGSPKVGKSWAALGIALAVASGRPALGGVDVDAGDVLYLALEDGPRRLRDRLAKLLRGDTPPDRLRFLTHAPAIGEGLSTVLDDWRAEADAPRLVVVDVLAKIKPASDGRGSAYAEDYAALAPLQQWATANRVAVVVVHHTRKARDDDYLASVSGTHGLAGASDAVLVLVRSRTSSDAVLSVTGRDIIEREAALTFDGDAGSWRLAGGSLDTAATAAHTVRATAGVGDRMAEVVAYVLEADAPVSPSEAADALEVDADTAGRYLRRAVSAGRIARAGRGTYVPLTYPLSEVSEVSGTDGSAPHEPDTPDRPDRGTGGVRSCRGCGKPADRTSATGAPWCSTCWQQAAGGAA